MSFKVHVEFHVLSVLWHSGGEESREQGMLVLPISSVRKELTFETPSQSPSV